MTPRAGESQQVPKKQSFSELLLLHAKVLELTQTSPVGEWTIGQGIRRGNDKSFFYDLRAHNHSPFGVNHPVALAALSHPEELKAQSLPQAPSSQWAVVEAHHPLVAGLTHLGPDARLRFPSGWEGLAHSTDWSNWGVHLGEDLVFVCTKDDLGGVPQTAPARMHTALIKLLLSADVLGPQGRYQEWRTQLPRLTSQGRWEGLSFYFSPARLSAVEAQTALGQQGIAVDVVGTEVNASFGLSMFLEDATRILQKITAH